MTMFSKTKNLLMILIIYPYWILNLKLWVLIYCCNSLIIYPYWILNYLRYINWIVPVDLIIYPYWILNGDKDDDNDKTGTTYNLSILDFK